MTQGPSLQRFLEAQESDYAVALSEVKQGRKRSHWMWYIFPQLQGLGFSETSRHYGIHGLAEAIAYLEHPILGARLAEISEALLQLPGSDPHAIFGSPDALKLKSSMTLFAEASPTTPFFPAVLAKYFSGTKDTKTLDLLRPRGEQ